MRIEPLIIIDVQNGYSPYSTQPELIRAIVKHVKIAQKKNSPIVCVEYQGEGQTIPGIISELFEYNRITKNQCDGSKKIAAFLKKTYTIQPPNTLKLCGLFTQDCVAKTADGLTRMGFKIKIIEEACTASEWSHKMQLDYWRKTQEVKVIYKSPPTRKFVYD